MNLVLKIPGIEAIGAALVVLGERIVTLRLTTKTTDKMGDGYQGDIALAHIVMAIALAENSLPPGSLSGPELVEDRIEIAFKCECDYDVVDDGAVAALKTAAMAAGFAL